MAEEEPKPFAVVVDDQSEDREDVVAAFPVGRLKTCDEYESREEFSLEFLGKRKSYSSLPSILFIDIRMEADNSGIELLKEIKKRKRLKRIPVIIISGSDEDEDISSAYVNGANVYLVKSDEPGEFTKHVRLILRAYLTGKLPSDISGYLDGN